MPFIENDMRLLAWNGTSDIEGEISDGRACAEPQTRTLRSLQGSEAPGTSFEI